ncbi:MAG: O-antigen ligase family protein [Minisyncoccota bacterium]
MEKELNLASAHTLHSIFFGLGCITLGIILTLFFGISPFLSFLGAIGLCILFLSLFNPFLFLLALIIIRMSLDYSAQYFSLTFLDFSFSLSQIIGILIACFGSMVLIYRYKALPQFPLFFPFLLIFLWGLLTLIYSITPQRTAQELLRFFDIFTLSFLAFLTVKSKTDFQKILSAFFLSTLVPIIFALYQFIFSIGFQDESVTVPRIFGTFSHPNVFSLYLFTVIVFAFLALTIEKKSLTRRMLVTLLLIVLILTLLLTFARVAWVTLFFFGFCVALFRYRMTLIPLILFPLILFVFSETFQARIQGSLTVTPDSSIVWRQNLWSDVTAKSVQDGGFLFGSGMDTFSIVSESLRGTRLGSNDPHNDFVKFFVEGGLVGVIVYCIYLLSILVLLISYYRRNKTDIYFHVTFGILIILFVSLQIASLSDNVFKNTPVQWLFFIALGSIFGLYKTKYTKNI